MTKNSPDALEVHGADLDDVSCLLALQDAVAAATGHASNIEEFGAVDHVVILAARNADALGFNLETQAAFIFP